jgi:hypothetical protein
MYAILPERSVRRDAAGGKKKASKKKQAEKQAEKQDSLAADSGIWKELKRRSGDGSREIVGKILPGTS